MKFIWGVLVAGLFLPVAARAQQDNNNADGYNPPDVEINRSVLKELKGYAPPPMFAPAPAPEPDKKSDAKPAVTQEPHPTAHVPVLTPPVADTTPGPAPVSIVTTTEQPTQAPTLTAPSAETLLGHPNENFHVLTQQKGSDIMTAPAPSADLPVPTGKAPVPAKKIEPKKAAAKKETPKKDVPKKETLTILAPAAKPFAKEQKAKVDADVKTDQVKDVKPVEDTLKDKVVMPKVTPNPYKIKSPKSMPAVPPVSVEKSPLSSGALPLTSPTAVDNAPKPSVGDRIIDQALTDKMEKDTNKIKQVLAATPAIKNAAPVKDSEKVTPVLDVPDVPDVSNLPPPGQISFEFAAKASTLTKDQINQLDKVIMPELTKDSALRVEILAYAKADGSDDSAARRVALSRALSMRQYFIDHNIPPARMGLHALGSNTTLTPLDRVDIVTHK